MTYALLADLVVVVHAAFVLFTVFGGLLALRWRWVAALHLPALGWGVYIELAGRVCPLTPLENSLRAAAGEPTYTGDFIAQYAISLLYPEDLTRETQRMLAVLLGAFNVVVYALVWRRHWRRGRGASSRGTSHDSGSTSSR